MPLSRFFYDQFIAFWPIYTCNYLQKRENAHISDDFSIIFNFFHGVFLVIRVSIPRNQTPRNEGLVDVSICVSSESSPKTSLYQSSIRAHLSRSKSPITLDMRLTKRSSKLSQSPLCNAMIKGVACVEIEAASGLNHGLDNNIIFFLNLLQKLFDGFRWSALVPKDPVFKVVRLAHAFIYGSR